MANELSNMQKLMLFEQATRQNKQPAETIAFVENSMKNVVLPKSRTLAKISLLVQGTFKLTHASKTTYTAKGFSKYNLIKNIRLKLNNGFAPYNISGVGLKMYNEQNQFKAITDGRNVLDYITNVVDTSGNGGGSNSVCFMLDMPITVNDRDFIGLLDMQASGVNVELELTMGAIADIMTDTDVVASSVAITVKPILETFSIPPLQNHMPRFNTIKTVSEQKNPITSTGDTTIKLPIGLTYRKILAFMKQDANYTPIALSRINDFSILINQADYPYVVPAVFLAAQNTKQHGVNLTDGLYSFDFSNNGIANYGSGRDYMDSENLSEFWLRVNMASLSGSVNEIITITEQIAEI